MDSRWSLCWLVPLASFLLFTPGMLNAEKKVTIGTVEDVILLPWKVKLPARIDTGAAKSSLDARELKVHEDTVEFKLPRKYGDSVLAAADHRVATCSHP